MRSGSVYDRIAALGRFAAAARDHLPPAALAPAEALIGRAGERLALSREHTVVALAGSTGAGKSSIFNCLAGADLSASGVRRPTTGRTHACVWGEADASALLDWLGVGQRHHRAGQDDLAGLVLLDLPDFDSVQTGHRVEADRLLAAVDLIVWILHPQKYADKLVHRSYLSRFHRHRDITVVVLNQADLLSPQDLHECQTHLQQLLAEDGLAGMPIVTASTIGPPGLRTLEGVLDEAVAARRAALQRLDADLAGVVATLEPQVGPATPKEALGKSAAAQLTGALARAAGAPLVADATEKAYVHRARKRTGWPPLRWLRRLRPDPLSRLHLGMAPDDRPDNAASPAATSLGPAAPAEQAALGLALRDVARQAGQSLPGPWQDALLGAVRSRQDDLPDALDRVVAQTDLGLSQPRRWWRMVGGLHWLALGAAVTGLLWLVLRYALFALALPEPPMPLVGRLPLPTALLGGGLLFGLLLAILMRPLVRLGARRRRRQVTKKLHAGVTQVAEDLVIAPARQVLTDYNAASSALRSARLEPVL